MEKSKLEKINNKKNLLIAFIVWIFITALGWLNLSPEYLPLFSHTIGLIFFLMLTKRKLQYILAAAFISVCFFIGVWYLLPIEWIATASHSIGYLILALFVVIAFSYDSIATHSNHVENHYPTNDDKIFFNQIRDIAKKVLSVASNDSDKIEPINLIQDRQLTLKVIKTLETKLNSFEKDTSRRRSVDTDLTKYKIQLELEADMRNKLEKSLQQEESKSNNLLADIETLKKSNSDFVSKLEFEISTLKTRVRQLQQRELELNSTIAVSQKVESPLVDAEIEKKFKEAKIQKAIKDAKLKETDILKTYKEAETLKLKELETKLTEKFRAEEKVREKEFNEEKESFLSKISSFEKEITKLNTVEKELKSKLVVKQKSALELDNEKASKKVLEKELAKLTEEKASLENLVAGYRAVQPQAAKSTMKNTHVQTDQGFASQPPSGLSSLNGDEYVAKTVISAATVSAGSLNHLAVGSCHPSRCPTPNVVMSPTNNNQKVPTPTSTVQKSSQLFASQMSPTVVSTKTPHGKAQTQFSFAAVVSPKNVESPTSEASNSSQHEQDRQQYRQDSDALNKALLDSVETFYLPSDITNEVVYGQNSSDILNNSFQQSNALHSNYQEIQKSLTSMYQQLEYKDKIIISLEGKVTSLAVSLQQQKAIWDETFVRDPRWWSVEELMRLSQPKLLDVERDMESCLLRTREAKARLLEMENIRNFSTPRRHSNDANAKNHIYQYQYNQQQQQQQQQLPRSASKYYASNGYNQVPYSESEQRQFLPQSGVPHNRNLHSQAPPFVPQSATSFNVNSNRSNFPSNASVFTPKTQQNASNSNNIPVNAENSSTLIKLNEVPESSPPVDNLNNSN